MDQTLPIEISVDLLSNTNIKKKLIYSPTPTLLANATACLYSYKGKIYLITNWHNVTGTNPITKLPIGNHAGRPDILDYVLMKEDQTFEWETYSIGLYDDEGNAQWYYHPGHNEAIDVIAIEISTTEHFKFKNQPVNDIDYQSGILKSGDITFILGFPEGLTGGENLPIWKRGSIASQPGMSIQGLPKILIDTASRPGMSGSPVFFRRTGVHIPSGVFDESTNIGTIEDFVGIYSGRLPGKTTFDAQIGIVWDKMVIEEIIEGDIKDKFRIDTNYPLNDSTRNEAT